MIGAEGMNTKTQGCWLLLYLKLVAAALKSLLGRNLPSIIILVSGGKVKDIWPALKLQDLIPIPTENRKTTEGMDFSTL